MHGEIHFHSELDQYFGVQTNKSRFGLDPRMKEVLQESVDDLLDQVLKDHDSETQDRISARISVGHSTSEDVIRSVSDRLESPVLSPSEQIEATMMRGGQGRR